MAITAEGATTADTPLTTGDEAWRGFAPGPWQDGVDVRDFIQRNYAPYPVSYTHLTLPTKRIV